MSVELEEFEPGRWRVKRDRSVVQRAENLPLPFVISDTMEPVEQVDGRFYTSKRAFRAVGRALGLVEVGTEKIPPKQRNAASMAAKEARRQSLRIAAAKVRAGAK